MSNPIYNTLGGGNTLISQINQLRNNPIQFLMNRRLNVPENLSNNPQGIVQHLLNTGQMSQETYNRIQNQVSQLMR